MINKQDLPGQISKIRGNEPILLNDPQTVWLVRTGAIAIFMVTVQDDLILGNRRYLFNCEPNEALFGTIPSLGKTDSQILAVPIGETELLKLDREFLNCLVSNADIRVDTWIKNWLDKFSDVLATISLPPIQVKAETQERFSLSNGQTWQPEADRVVWIKIQQGYLRWLGWEELTLTNATVTMPINDAMWLSADGAVQLTTHTTKKLQDTNTLLLGLSQLHKLLLNYVKFQTQQEHTEELQRLKDRESLNNRITVTALRELASPLMSQSNELSSGDAPLLVAAGAVGKVLGVTIRPPSVSEDLDRVKEPLEAIARASRLRVRQVLLRDKWWLTDCGALVAYKKEIPVALLPVKSDRYEMLDPTTQTRILVNKENAVTLNPMAYIFYRSLPDKALNVIDVLRFALSGRVKDLIVIILTGIAATLLGMLTPHATRILIDNAIPDSDRGLLLQIGGGLVLAAIAISLFRLTQGFSLLRVETTSDAYTQAAVWDRLLNLPVSFFRHYTTGDLQSRVSSVSTIRRHLGGNTLIQLITGLFGLLNLVLLFYYSVKLALVAVAVAFIVAIITSISGVILVRKVRPLLELEGNIFGQIVQLINGISKLRVAGAEKRAFAAWSKNYSQQIQLELSTQLVEDIVAVFNTVIPTIISGVLFWFTLKLLTDAQTQGQIGLTVGTFLAFNTAFRTFLQGVTSVSNTVTNTLEVVPQWHRAQPILKTIPEIELTKADPGKLIGRINIEHVSFRYRPDIPLTLEDINIQIEPGEFIALVGSSGSGKSTLLRLLLGFETPEEGSIHYDGQDLTGLDISAVRRQLGVVLQNGKIMSGPIFDNLAGGARINLEEAWNASRMAGLKDDISKMPMGMHTVISEGGGNLSGGQRQRLLIAKALVLKPNILFFDEATSALDNKTQAIVSDSLDKLQVTRIVIAHRLSTIRKANRIYVLQSGRVIQQGSFDQLVNTPGVFANLMQRQM
ncbi:NHLP bacteriocin export ABC transporter permease/ATPase subunit [Pleurocapsa sp. PCC 7319]|uniref:NHLP bacteriocin export ABC transporter permease/ATPase subunit n=1 Tax=Pleurocapsa sp. PCC 7319 TaxID=118161 RepID=UPI0003494740|nr:NHLP bacteriocin export ABC transporter permease/ATPase subunit [Pleurocapsa sp. PCC 7319]